MSSTRIGGIALAAVALGGCVPQGMRGAELLNLEEAEQRQLRYSVYEMSEAGAHGAQIVSWDGRSWMAGNTPETLPARLMRQVGEIAGEPVYAPAWSRAPHTTVFTQAGEGRWFPLLQVP